MSANDEFPGTWWGYKEKDRLGAERYVQTLIRVKAGDREALEQYDREVMAEFS